MNIQSAISLAAAAISAVMTLMALGVFIYTEMVYQRPLPADQVEFENMQRDLLKKIIPDPFTLKKIIINLESKQRSRLRYLNLTISLVPFKSEQAAIMEKRQSAIYDMVIDIAGKMSPEELNSVTGKIILEDRIKKRINFTVGVPIVKEIHFSQFVIQ